jgi:hypothetical protein
MRTERLTMKLNASHRGDDLIWRTHMQREEYSLNQRTRALEICEAHLCRRECRCDRCEAEVRTANKFSKVNIEKQLQGYFNSSLYRST